MSIIKNKTNETIAKCTKDDRYSFATKKLIFAKLVRDKLQEIGEDYRIKSNAIFAIQEAFESHVISLFEAANALVNNEKRVVVMSKDFFLAETIKQKK